MAINTTNLETVINAKVVAATDTTDSKELLLLSKSIEALGASAGSTTSTTNPSITENKLVGHIWINSASGDAFVCTDATTGANVWTAITQVEEGLIVQALSFLDNTLPVIASSSSTFAPTNTSLSITPSSANSKIIISYNGYADADSGGDVVTTIYRGSTNLAPPTVRNGFAGVWGGGGRTILNVGAQFVDTPTTTDPITYTIYIKVQSTGFARWRTDELPATITLMEVLS